MVCVKCSYETVCRNVDIILLCFNNLSNINNERIYKSLNVSSCSLMGYDLNRHWQEPSPWSHPTLYATKNLLMEMDTSDVRYIHRISLNEICV